MFVLMITEFDRERICQMQHHVYLKLIEIFDRAVKKYIAFTKNCECWY